MHSRLALLTIVLFLTALAPAAAPLAASVDLPATQPVSAAAPIAVPDILARADEDQQRLDAAIQRLAAPSPVQRLARELDDIAGPVSAKLRSNNGAVLRQLPIMRLESLARHWDFDARRFGRWELHARRTFAPYNDAAVQLAQRRAAWSATRAAGLLDGLPPVMSDRVDAVLAQLDAAERGLGTALASQFKLTQRGAELKAEIQTGRNDVAAAIDNIDKRLLQIDVPPLWHGLGPDSGSVAAFAAMQRGLAIESQFARDYHAAATGNQQALRVVQGLLLPLILWLSLRSRRAADDAQTGAVARALRRPLSAWLLLSMLSVLVLEPDAPLLLQECALLVALVPVLRLLPASAPRLLGLWPYVAIALYGLDRLGLAAVLDAAVYRLFLLLLNGLALGLTVRMLRQPLPAATTAPARRLQGVMRQLGWAVLATLLLALACNIAGNTSLAETLTSGVIDSGYMALLLYAGVTACQGLLRALLNQPEVAEHRLMERYRPVLTALCTRLLVTGAVLGWLLYTMHRFRVLRPLYELWSSVTAAGIEVGEVSVHLGDILVFMLASWLAFWAARGVRSLLREELPGHSRLPRGVGNSIASLSYYGVLLLGLLIALSAAGFQVGQLALVFGALGVGIGFGLQNVVNNFVSGLVLMFERPIQPGDVVDAAGISGTVREIGLRATTIRTFDGADAVVPNGALLSANLTNWTMFDRSRRFEILVGVAYGSDPALVLALLAEAAATTPGVAPEPAPVTLLTSYGDSALNFSVRVWTSDLATWMDVRSQLLARSLAALDGAGISIPYQQIDLHVRSAPQGGPAPSGQG